MTYDTLAESYDQPGRMEHPIRQGMYQRWLETCGDLQGLHVIDLGCGAGVSSRLLLDAGAQSVFGVDISSEMLKIAHSHEVGKEFQVSYQEGDMYQPMSLPQADLVTSMLAVHYASTRGQLSTFFANVSNCLPTGGRFVAELLDPEQTMPFTLAGSNCRAHCVEERADGRVITAVLLDAALQPICKAPLNYQWRKETYEDILAHHGFTDIRWTKTGLEQTLVTILTATKE